MSNIPVDQPIAVLIAPLTAAIVMWQKQPWFGTDKE